MKKTLLIILLITAFISSYSQSSKFSIGAEVGPLLSSMRGDNSKNDESMFGFSGGVNVEYELTNIVSLKSGLFYENKGAQREITIKFKDENETFNFNYKFHYDYITLPLLISYHSNSDLNFYLSGGAYIGYLVDRKSIINDLNAKKFNQTEVGLTFELGFIILLTDKISLNYELKDNIGLTSITPEGILKTNSIIFSTGIKFRI